MITNKFFLDFFDAFRRRNGKQTRLMSMTLSKKYFEHCGNSWLGSGGTKVTLQRDLDWLTSGHLRQVSL
jgi:hypothetical protein